MLNLRFQGDPAYPVFVFEVDAAVSVLASSDGWRDLYEDEWWDEVHAAFDHDCRAVMVSCSEGIVTIALHADAPADPAGFAELARRSLTRVYRAKRLRQIRPSKDQRRDLADLGADRLMRMILDSRSHRP